MRGFSLFTRIAVLLIMLLEGVPSWGQISGVPDSYGAPMRVNKKADLSGKVYYHEDWNKGSITWVNGSTSENLYIRYNAYTNKVEVKKDDAVWEYTEKHIIKFQYSAYLAPDIIVISFCRASDVFQGNKGFVRVLFQDNVGAFEEISTELIDSAPSYSTTQASSRVIKRTKNFLRFSNKPDKVFFKRTNSGLSKVVVGVDLKDYLKDNNLNVSRDEDFIKALEYINTLN